MTAMTTSTVRNNRTTNESGVIYTYLVGASTYTYAVPFTPTGKTIRIVSCTAQDGATAASVSVTGTTSLTIDTLTLASGATKFVLAYYFE